MDAHSNKHVQKLCFGCHPGVMNWLISWEGWLSLADSGLIVAIKAELVPPLAMLLWLLFS